MDEYVDDATFIHLFSGCTLGMKAILSRYLVDFGKMSSYAVIFDSKYRQYIRDDMHCFEAYTQMMNNHRPQMTYDYLVGLLMMFEESEKYRDVFEKILIELLLINEPVFRHVLVYLEINSRLLESSEKLACKYTSMARQILLF